jgi:hypothetical protein
MRKGEPARAWPLTRKAAYFFLIAPWPHHPIRALRWAQVRSAGGDARLARAVAHSRLGGQLWEPDEERWWAGALLWLTSQAEVPLEHVNPLLEYVATRRCGCGSEGAPDLTFRMKGRALLPLLRQAAEWVEVRPLAPNAGGSFPPSGIPGARWRVPAEAGITTWTIEEILDRTALLEEALRMHHCVRSYEGRLRRGVCSLWSVQCGREGVTRRALTVEVRNRTIVQVHGQFNRAPKEQEREILRRWASECGLRYPETRL